MRHPRATPAPSPRHPRIIPARRDHHPTDLKTVSFRCHNRSSVRRPCLQVLQSHLRVAKQSSIGPSARRPCPQIFQRHPRVADHPQPISKRFLSGVITGLRHRDPAHRFFRAISAWRSSHLSALRHGDPAQRYPRGIILWRDGLKPVIYLCSSMKLAFFMDVEVWTWCSSMKLAFFMDVEV